jgi:SAM-dependent methyltransferase
MRFRGLIFIMDPATNHAIFRCKPTMRSGIMKKRDDIPPAWNEVGKHALFPQATHDEVARFNFLANFNKHIAMALGAGNKLAFDTRVEPKLQAELGRAPTHRHEIRKAMNKDPYHRFWSALKRNAMEMRQQAGRSMVLRQADALASQAAALSAQNAATLQLDPAVSQPRYMAAVDIHCMPGSYHTSHFPGDVTAGANYDCGIFVTTGGALGKFNDGGGQALVQWIKAERPGWVPRRVLDIGSTVGHNIVPLALAFPDTEFYAVDTAEPVLRYGHARAQAMGATNIRFIQMNCEDLSRFEDGFFDWVQTTMFLHETSGKALPKMMQEFYRVLAPGGLLMHVEQPQYTDAMPLYEQFIRDWDAFNNNEPFWSSMHGIDMDQAMLDAGFGREDLVHTGVRAVVDPEIFPPAPAGAQEDHGRAAVWHAFGAWKKAEAAKLAAE